MVSPAWGELMTAVAQLSNDTAPGLDGLPAEFFKRFWSCLGSDLHQVLEECVVEGELPLSCHRAVLTLLPKKRDLCKLKNWQSSCVFAVL